MQARGSRAGVYCEVQGGGARGNEARRGEARRGESSEHTSVSARARRCEARASKHTSVSARAKDGESQLHGRAMQLAVLALALVWLLQLSGSAGFQPGKSKAVQFTGGGIFFWWQAGFCRRLLEEGFREQALSSDVKIIGTSAGALSAALLASGADFSKAADVAIALSAREKVFETGRLAFVWGKIVEEWLEVLIPDEPTSPLLLSNTFITATPADLCKGIRQVTLSGFASKQDVIGACMASAHIPFFMDAKATRRYKGVDLIDGSFWPFVLGDERFEAWRVKDSPSSFSSSSSSSSSSLQQVYNVDWQADSVFREQVSEGFTSMLSPSRVADMMEYGYRFAQKRPLT